MKRKEKMIYILNTCNAWEEYSSMSIVCATTKVETLFKSIKKLLRGKDAEFAGYEGREAVKEFNLFINEGGCVGIETIISRINSRLDYAYIKVFEDGEGE